MSVSPEKKSSGRGPADMKSQARSNKQTEEKDSNSNSNGVRQGLQSIKDLLLSKRSELMRHQEAQLDALDTTDKHHLADIDEMSSDTVDMDSLCALVDIGSHTLEQIDAALERIEEGTYGLCEECKQPIAPERLEVLPFAAHCIDCQRKSKSDN